MTGIAPQCKEQGKEFLTVSLHQELLHFIKRVRDPEPMSP